MERVSDWIQIITGVSILIGLGLVIWELRQTRAIAESQQAAGGFDQYANQQLTMLGEDPASVIAKACENPDDLNVRDMLVLSAYYTGIVNRMRRGLVTSEPGLGGDDWRRWTVNFGSIFATEYGKWWWKNTGWEPEIRAAGEAWLSENPTSSTCLDYFGTYRHRNSDD